MSSSCTKCAKLPIRRCEATDREFYFYSMYPLIRIVVQSFRRMESQNHPFVLQVSESLILILVSRNKRTISSQWLRHCSEVGHCFSRTTGLQISQSFIPPAGADSVCFKHASLVWALQPASLVIGRYCYRYYRPTEPPRSSQEGTRGNWQSNNAWKASRLQWRSISALCDGDRKGDHALAAYIPARWVKPLRWHCKPHLIK